MPVPPEHTMRELFDDEHHGFREVHRGSEHDLRAALVSGTHLYVEDALNALEVELIADLDTPQLT